MGTLQACHCGRWLLNVVREDDLPGSEAPAARLNHLRGGDAVDLRRVASRNHQDVVSLMLLLAMLAHAPSPWDNDGCRTHPSF
jgi:uncharacterized protein YprB with RNaseH-like and TPR domain